MEARLTDKNPIDWIKEMNGNSTMGCFAPPSC